ncbi:response regulator [Aphanothece hegewaldii]|nr:response regulator [Aphanothece hegewaldii]
MSHHSAVVRLIQKLLSQADDCSLAQDISFTLTCSKTLEEGLNQLSKEIFNVILFDLMISNGEDVKTLNQLREQFPQLPIIVYTDKTNENLIIQALQLGADGHLRTEHLDCNLLIYQIRIAIERRNHIIKLEQIQSRQQELEFIELEEIIETNTSITARMFGAELLRQSVPELFGELVQTYGNLLDLALEKKAYKVDYDISEQLRTLANKLGFLKASPRDVVEIHTITLKEKNQDVTLAKAQAYVSEGRIMVLELMGHLASFYRKYYIGLSNIHLATKTNPRS